MSSKSEKDRTKQIQDKCQSLLTSMLRDDDNKYCVDCDSKGPRWASWNLGVFLCIRCAGIHRNLGVHISRVKSVNLDTWTPEQVVSLQQMGNSRARAVYEALLPDGFRRPQTDSSLEAFVRAKYEQKKYLAREWVPPPPVKVDWDKEIDEELEKQKKKKKTVSNASTSVIKKSEAIPKLLPMPNAKINSSSVTGKNQDHNKPINADLLGLDTKSCFSEDFNVFLPTEPSKNLKPNDTSDPLKTEEDNFFNQQVPTENEKAKLTKDSILALYDTMPVKNNQFQTNSLVFGNYPVQSTGQSMQQSNASLQSAFTSNALPFSANVSNPLMQNNSFYQLANQQQFPTNQQFNVYNQGPSAQAQFPNSVITQNSKIPYMQNGSGFSSNSQAMQNNSDLIQGPFSQNNSLPINNISYSTNNSFTPDQKFGQQNQCFGITQQFENISISKQNQFNSAGNLWQ